VVSLLGLPIISLSFCVWCVCVCGSEKSSLLSKKTTYLLLILCLFGSRTVNELKSGILISNPWR